jgi:hypothetical protein
MQNWDAVRYGKFTERRMLEMLSAVPQTPGITWHQADISRLLIVAIK